MERFSAGLVLSSGLRMFARVMLRLLPVLLAINAPPVAALVLADASELGGWFLLVLDVPTAAIVAHAVVHELRGAPASALASLAAGLRRTLPALGVMALVYLVLFATLFAIGLPLSVAARVDSSGVVSLIFLLGMLAIGVALYSRWFVVIPAVVLERPGAAGALSRSGDLTRGHRPALAGVIVTVTVAYLAVIIGLVAAVGASYQASDSGVWLRPDELTPALVSTTLTLYVLFGILRATLSAAAYHHLRAARDARSPEELAKVFD